MFSKSAKFYNATYASLGKDHAVEAHKVLDIIQLHKKSAGNTLQEVACGTEIHASVLRSSIESKG